jgi:hypothetical protein
MISRGNATNKDKLVEQGVEDVVDIAAAAAELSTADAEEQSHCVVYYITERKEQ